MDKAMPDKAIDVLDEAGASMNMTIEKPENIKLLEARKTEIMETKKMVVLNKNMKRPLNLGRKRKLILSYLLLILIGKLNWH
jgi:ATP-dependent Clp protease ATP-binding subunit ClpA